MPEPEDDPNLQQPPGGSSNTPSEPEGETPPQDPEEGDQWWEDDDVQVDPEPEEEPEPEAEQPKPPVPLPDIPGVTAISDDVISSLTPLLETDPEEFVRQVVAVAQHSARSEMQAQQASDQQISRVFGGRDDIIREYGPTMRRILATVKADVRHTPRNTRAALLAAVDEEAQTQGDAALDHFAEVWLSKRKPAARAAAPASEPARRTPSPSGSPGAAVPPSAARRTPSAVQELISIGIAPGVAEQLANDPAVGRRGGR